MTTKTILRQFNADEWTPEKTVINREGSIVRVLCNDSGIPEYPVVAIFDIGEGLSQSEFTHDGRFHLQVPVDHRFDLFFVEEVGYFPRTEIPKGLHNPVTGCKTYYTPSQSNENMFVQWEYIGSEINITHDKRDVMYKTKEQAIWVAKAMRGEFDGEYPY